ncbi:MAG: hypothetical protein IJU94_00080 [Clostridia bacterium]|nr:hypothetical protein [Clostridia bacterium]
MDRFAIRRGSGVPAASDLAEFELGYRTEAKSLYIGTQTGPVLLASNKAASGSFPYLRVAGVYSPAQVPAGSIFEGSDGRLYFKNTRSFTVALSEPPEPEPEDDEEEE